MNLTGKEVCSLLDPDLSRGEAYWWREITQDDQTSSSDAESCRDSSLLVLGYRYSQFFTVATEVIDAPDPYLP